MRIMKRANSKVVTKDYKGEPDQLSEDKDENTNSKVITKDNKGEGW